MGHPTDPRDHGRDHTLAADLAQRAGQVLLELRARLQAEGATPDQVRAEGDAVAHRWLVAALAEQAPGDAVLSEEGDDDAARLTADRVWILDPLDGTREFGEPGRGDWAVHVALVVDGAPVAGAVALPAQGRTLCTQPAPPLPALAPTPRMVVSRSRPPALAAAVAERLGAQVVPMGSAGAKAAAVILGAADVYLHAGGQREWDSCAPVAVALAAGLHASRLDGSRLVYNQPDVVVPDLAVCHPDLWGPVAEALAQVG